MKIRYLIDEVAYDDNGLIISMKHVGEVIRCKDCKWYGDGYLCYNTETLGMQPDDYCSLAEREEE